MDKLKNFAKNKVLIVITLLIFAVLSFTVYTLSKNEQKEEDSKKAQEYQEKVDKAPEITIYIQLKEMVIKKGEKLSTDFLDYVDVMPDGVDINKLELDLSQVNNKVVGDYTYTITYYESVVSNIIHVVETDEEKEILNKEIIKKKQELQQQVEQTEKDAVELDKKQEEEKKNQEVNNNNNTDNKNNNSSNNENNNESNNNPTTKPTTPTKPIDKKITSYSYSFNPNIPGEDSNVDLSGYNGELWYVFDVPVTPDVAAQSALFNWQQETNGDSLAYSEAYKLALNKFGKESMYCVQYTTVIYARNKDKDIVGFILKTAIGTKNEYDLCENNLTTVYSNSKKTLTYDTKNVIFKEK